LPKKYPSLTLSEVKQILKFRGFELANTTGSHAQYSKTVNGVSYKVTVDLAENEFYEFLLQSMIRQSGLSRVEFYCSTKSTAKKINHKFNK